MANKETLLSVRNLTVEYTSEGEIIHAVNNVSFDLEKGKTIGLVGETGAGKTSIARSILRILPEPPARVPNGEIYFEGQDLLKISETDMQRIRGKEISMIFQDPMTALNPIMRWASRSLRSFTCTSTVPRTKPSKRPRRCWKWWAFPGSVIMSIPISSLAE